MVKTFLLLDSNPLSPEAGSLTRLSLYIAKSFWRSVFSVSKRGFPFLKLMSLFILVLFWWLSFASCRHHNRFLRVPSWSCYFINKYMRCKSSKNFTPQFLIFTHLPRINLVFPGWSHYQIPFLSPHLKLFYYKSGN